MTAKQLKAFKWCVDNGIRIYPRPVRFSFGKSRPDVNLIIDNNGKKTKGKIVYKQDLEGQKEYSEKINELYEAIYTKGKL